MVQVGEPADLDLADVGQPAQPGREGLAVHLRRRTSAVLVPHDAAPAGRAAVALERQAAPADPIVKFAAEARRLVRRQGRYEPELAGEPVNRELAAEQFFAQ